MTVNYTYQIYHTSKMQYVSNNLCDLFLLLFYISPLFYTGNSVWFWELGQTESFPALTCIFLLCCYRYFICIIIPLSNCASFSFFCSFRICFFNFNIIFSFFYFYLSPVNLTFDISNFQFLQISFFHSPFEFYSLPGKIEHLHIFRIIKIIYLPAPNT